MVDRRCWVSPDEIPVEALQSILQLLDETLMKMYDLVDYLDERPDDPALAALDDVVVFPVVKILKQTERIHKILKQAEELRRIRTRDF